MDPTYLPTYVVPAGESRRLASAELVNHSFLTANYTLQRSLVSGQVNSSGNFETVGYPKT